MNSSSYPKRKIGDFEFNAIGFGAMGLSAFYGSVGDDEERFKVLDRAYELGCRHWDTARAYADSESLIGKWFTRNPDKRADIFLATKFGLTADLGACGTADFLRASIEESLKNLKTDYVDLLYQHRVDPQTPIEVTVRELAKLVKEGKVRYIGLSECSSASLRRAHVVHPIAAIEVEYSPFILDIENPKIGLLQTARELGVKIVAYSPMGRGILTGQYQECFPKILQIAEGLKNIGVNHNNATAGQIALAWLLQQGDDIIPIPGTKHIKYLEENIAAAKIALSAEEVKTIRRLIDEAGIPSAVARYPEAILHLLFADSPSE
ncbi:hypothetical protein Clacol_009569 [Clathrus columnatus]|uniref:NADP-dependent oxidoreductase domain-containing protein n=1 Tax=Clathrus columnatus TaxID=1419009 RepID=A0AAV5AQH9_9AGAM|nr:hypothetical protein Clacol_009569 [Clathrus columnatus]